MSAGQAANNARRVIIVGSTGEDGTFDPGPVAIVGQIAPVAMTVTRPADTTAYAANDGIANATSGATLASFAAGRVATGSGLIVGVTLQLSNAAATHRIELDIYNDTITAINDNAEATRLVGNVAKFVGTILLPALAKKTTNSTVSEAQNFDVRLPYKCVAGGLLYAVPRTLDAHTPASASVYTFIFHVDQN